jgi:hypothetical protein
MLRRRFTRLRFCFRTEARKELRRHHLRRALNHTLANAGDRAANLNIARVLNLRDRAILCEIEIARAFEKTRSALAVDDHPKVFGLAQIFEPHVAIKHAFNRTDAGADRRRKRIVTGSFEAFATRNTTLQHLGIDERLIDAFARRFQFVSSFELHRDLFNGRLRSLNRTLQMNLREMTTILTRRVEIRVRIDAVARVRCRVSDRLFVEI